MNFDNFRIDRVDLNPFERSLPPQNYDVNIVIIDKSLNRIFPLAYQFNHDLDYSDDLLFDLSQTFPEDDNKSYICLGEVERINKHKRLITLRTKDFIRYKHLIILTEKANSLVNTLPQNKEFSSALHVLVDALKTKKKLQSRILALSLNHPLARRPGPITSQAKDTNEMHRIFDASTSNSNRVNKKQPTASKRLFEIQLFTDPEI